jgi:hypothetical protein
MFRHSLLFERETPMAFWTSEELSKIGAAEEVEIAPLASDGTLRKPVTVWLVSHGGDLYVRSVRGRGGHWYRGTQETHQGRLRAGGLQQDITFVDADNGIDDEVDAAYRAKYRRYAGSILNSVLTPEARSSTLKLVPRPAGT